MKIQILGTGCDKCKKLMANVESVVKEQNMDAELEKVTEITKIAEMGAMITPALAVDGKIVSAGKVLSTNDIVAVFQKENLLNACGCTSSCEDSNEPEEEATACCCSCCGSSGGGSSKGKKIVSIALILLIVGSIVTMVVRENKAKELATQSASKVEEIPQGTLVLYYFHGNQRCWTCNTIEERVKKLFNEKYSEQVNSGKIQLKVVNIEEGENAHFVEKFNSVKEIVLMKGDKFEVLPFAELRALVREPEANFDSYLSKGLDKWLK